MAVQESYLAASCEHLAVAAQYLARVAPISSLAFGTLHPLPPLALAGPLPHVLPPPPARPSQHHHHEHMLEIREDEDDEDEVKDDEDNEDDDHEDEDEDDDGGAIVVGGGGGDVDDDDEEFLFTVQDLYHFVWPLVAVVPPYPLYRKLSDTAVQMAAWVWYLFGNALMFTTRY